MDTLTNAMLRLVRKFFRNYSTEEKILGSCICEHNTEGDNCERCHVGYYGNPFNGLWRRSYFLKTKSLRNCWRLSEVSLPWRLSLWKERRRSVLHSLSRGFTHLSTYHHSLVQGLTGSRCTECQMGYYGNPKEGVECQKCECNSNADENEIEICDQLVSVLIRNTGKCHLQKDRSVQTLYA